jgi:hypothetical protein
VAHVGHWTAARWRRPGTRSTESTRADLVFGLAQRLADLGATVEGGPSRPVPRLDNDLALPDQVRVMVADLLVGPAPEDVLRTAATAIDATTKAL